MMMAEAQGDDDIFVYMGGDQQVPDGVVRARIHKSVNIIRARAFFRRRQLISVEFHGGVEVIEELAFAECPSLRSAIKLLGVKIIKRRVFYYCRRLTDVEFGDKLETIGDGAFQHCSELNNIRMPSVRSIGFWAFIWCTKLSDVECGEELEIIYRCAFRNCHKLKRIAFPLKGDMINGRAFYGCPELKAVDLVGGIHHTVASLHMESWRNEMNNEINRINQTLPTETLPRFLGDKTEEIQQWMEEVISRLDHYKAEHHQMLKEATTLLELALWKAKLGDNENDEKVAMERLRARKETRVTSCARIVIKNVLRVVGVRTARGSRERTKKELRVTSGADAVIRNVLPFLQLSE